MKKQNQATRLIIAALAGSTLPALAATGATPVFFGPSAYRSPADIPSGFYLGGSPALLDTLEDGSLDASLQGSGGAVISASFGGIRDSVDSDDGVIDGSCGPQTAGRCASWFNGSGNIGTRFSFVGAGALPTAFGLVWTDGFGSITFSAIGADGQSLGSFSASGFADGSSAATTGEDRFFGVQFAGGIRSIHISNDSGGIEVDHIQYGQMAPVPEPAGWGLMAAGLLGMVALRRRTSTGSHKGVATHALPATLLAGAGLFASAAQAGIQIGSIRELEGNSGQREVWLPITLPPDIHPQSQLLLSTMPGSQPAAKGGASCTPGVDFITVVDRPFRVNPNFPFVPVTICGDTAAESDKYVRVQAKHGMQVGQGDVVIVDEDVPPRLISVSRVRVQRNPVPFIRTPATFDVRLSHAAPNGAEVQIPYFTENGTAVPGGCRFEQQPNPLPPPQGQAGFVIKCIGDYEARNDVLRLPAGATQGSFSVQVLGGSNPQSSWFGVRIGQPVNAQLGLANTWSSVATIDPAARLMGSPASVAPFGRTTAIAAADRLPSGRLSVITLEWQAPDGRPWNTVDYLDLRPADPAAAGAWWRWDRRNGQFSLCQPIHSDGAGSRLNAHCQPAGSAETLALGSARLHPGLSRVHGGTQEVARMTLRLTLSFAPQGLSGPARRAILELAATDRFGNQGGFEPVLDAVIDSEAAGR